MRRPLPALLVTLTWLVLGVSACGASAVGSETQGSTQNALVATRTTEQCDYNRIAVRPGGKEFLLWLDRRPLFRAYGAYHPNSSLAWMRSRGEISFFALDGEVSALNWLADGDTAEFLISGQLHGSFEPERGVVTLRPVAPAWLAIGVKNLSWGGLSAALQDRSLTDGMPHDRLEIDRRRGFVLSAATREYHPLGPASGPLPVSTLDQSYPEALYSRTEPDVAANGFDLPTRPIFDAQTGRVVGRQDIVSPHLSAGGEAPAGRTVPGALLRDEVVLGDMRAGLYARPDGSHWLFVEQDRESWSEMICGPGLDGSRAELAFVPVSGIEYPAILETSNGVSAHLLVRFHGGPFGSVLDDFPSEAARRVARTGGSILEVSSPGSRHGAGSSSPRVDAETVRAYSRALAAWISRAGFTSVTVMGESFGAVGAVDFALEDRENVRGLVLLAPLTLFDPERSLTDRPIASDSFQWRGEQVIVGDQQGRRNFSEWLDRSIAEACEKLPLRVVLGAADAKTPPERQAPCIKQHSIVVPAADHYSLLRTDAAWDWLSDPPRGRMDEPSSQRHPSGDARERQ